jgi:hypothetical protein
MSRRGKTLIVVDVAVVAALAVAGVVFLLRPDNPGSSSSLYTPQPILNTESPHVTGEYLDWLARVCPSLGVINDLPDKPLPNAHWSGMCFHNDNTPVLIGEYGEQVTLDNDVSRRPEPHHHATGIDASNRIYVFYVQQADPSPLEPLQTLGFQLH